MIFPSLVLCWRGPQFQRKPVKTSGADLVVTPFAKNCHIAKPLSSYGSMAVKVFRTLIPETRLLTRLLTKGPQPTD